MKHETLSLYREPGHLLRRAHQIAVSLFLEESAPLDLTPVQYAAMMAVRSLGQTDATRLSALIAFDRSTLGNVLERLERKGLIVRQGAEGDKRVKVISLTPEGHDLLDRAAEPVARAQARIIAPLDPAERETFMALLDKMVRANNAFSRAPARRTED